MKLKLVRRFLGSEYTIGSLLINGVKFCDTLEDKVRDLNHDGDLDDQGEGKVYGQTAIPYGTYKIELSMSPHFKRELPRLVGVKGFEGVLIHRGNTDEDSSGCILVGENKIKGMVINSTLYEVNLVKAIRLAIADGESVEIEIV